MACQHLIYCYSSPFLDSLLQIAWYIGLHGTVKVCKVYFIFVHGKAVLTKTIQMKITGCFGSLYSARPVKITSLITNCAIVFQDTSRRYENKAGTFITGIDVNSKVQDWVKDDTDGHKPASHSYSPHTFILNMSALGALEPWVESASLLTAQIC